MRATGTLGLGGSTQTGQAFQAFLPLSQQIAISESLCPLCPPSRMSHEGHALRAHAVILTPLLPSSGMKPGEGRFQGWGWKKMLVGRLSSPVPGLLGSVLSSSVNPNSPHAYLPSTHPTVWALRMATSQAQVASLACMFVCVASHCAAGMP